jgi:pyruvate-ferredoxin/flavodoxin oxidoreductase
MQMAFFHLTQILPGDSALAELQGAIAKSYSSKGQELVERNWQALAMARESLAEVPLQPVMATARTVRRLSPTPRRISSKPSPPRCWPDSAMRCRFPALPPDGTWPMGTTRWEKRNIAEEIPVWKEALCTQCNHCVAACPHSAIRAKVVAPEAMEKARPACIPWTSNPAICAVRNTFCRSRLKIAPAVISASKFVRQKTDRIRKSRPLI